MAENCDFAEIHKFNQQAGQWWDKEGPFKTLHVINPTRLTYIQQRVPLKGKRVLDVGCGGGLFSEAMALTGAQVTGIDLGEESLAVAKQHAQESQLDIHYTCQSVELFAEKYPGYFDVISCMEMLEHVPDPRQILHACAQLVRPGGYLFFSTLNRNPIAYAMAILGGEYLTKLVPHGTHNYAQFIRPSELATWARECGLALQDFTGMHYNPFFQRADLTQDLTVNYLASFTC